MSCLTRVSFNAMLFEKRGYYYAIEQGRFNVFDILIMGYF